MKKQNNSNGRYAYRSETWFRTLTLSNSRISMRRVVQATNVRMEYIRKNKGEFEGPTVWLKSLGHSEKTGVAMSFRAKIGDGR